MEKDTRYLVYQPHSALYEVFGSYKEAWEFAERYFREGNGVALIEQVTRKN
jgi:hypothetical protein